MIANNANDYGIDPGVNPQQMQAAARMTASAGAIFQPECKLLWQSPEGQVSNFWVYVVAALTCPLVIPIIWAAWRYLCTSHHRWELTDQRLLEHSGIVVHRMETLELYRVIDIQVSGTLIQSLFGRGQVRLLTHDATTSHVTINAIEEPAAVANLIRNAVEQCRVAKGVRAVDV
ncbi:MAG: PH domain-containing protein [Burkholderiaceae bacterium]|jgi:membrane protein YdbS with pleckstrin-like domain|nr:PH domain-containing protein [Burkholderiaceae bacterium]